MPRRIAIVATLKKSRRYGTFCVFAARSRCTVNLRIRHTVHP